MDIMKKRRFEKLFRRRYSLRFHMGVILFATALSGVLFSKLLLVAHVEHFAVRYGITVVLSYLVFFLCVKLWLLYVSPGSTGGSAATDWSYVVPTGDGSACQAAPSASVPSGGGGQFSGAGASASFDSDSPAVAEVPMAAVAEGTSCDTGGVGDVVDGAVSAIGDDGVSGIIVLVVLAAIVAAVVGGAAYIIIEAPAILSEAAFEGLLAVSLMKNARRIDGQNWIGSVFKATWISFAVTLAVAALGGFVLHHYFPEAHRLLDVLGKGWGA